MSVSISIRNREVSKISKLCRPNFAILLTSRCSLMMNEYHCFIFLKFCLLSNWPIDYYGGKYICLQSSIRKILNAKLYTCTFPSRWGTLCRQRVRTTFDFLRVLSHKMKYVVFWSNVTSLLLVAEFKMTAYSGCVLCISSILYIIFYFPDET